MKTPILFTLLTIVLGVIPSLGQTSATPTREVTRLQNGYQIQYTIPTGIVKGNNAGNYLQITQSEFVPGGEVGTPELPYKIENIAVPPGFECQISVTQNKTEKANVKLQAVQKPKLGLPGDEEYTEIEPYKGLYPSKNFIAEPIQYFRGVAIQKIDVTPLQYDYENEQALIATDFTLTINFVPSEKDINKKISVNKDDRFLMNSTLNWKWDNEERFKTKTTGFDAYFESFMIISHPDLKEAVDKFAEWKRACGFKVFTQYDSAWTPKKIQDKINSYYMAYDNNDLQFKYIFLVGDAKMVPGKPFKETIYAKDYYWFSDDYLSDYTYGCLDGDEDLIPDMYAGRIRTGNCLI